MPEELCIVLATVVLSCLTSYIKISSESEENGRAVLCIESTVYLIIVAFGNTVASLLAPALIGAPEDAIGIHFPLWLWYPLFGVFGFQSIIGNVNVELLGGNLLSFESWIGQAEDNAVAAVVEKAVNLQHEKTQSTAELLQDLSEEELNTQFSQTLGRDRLKEIEDKCADVEVDAHMHKALVLAQEEAKIAESIVEPE